jgi:polyphosphate kinase 2 (PPK2 family)
MTATETKTKLQELKEIKTRIEEHQKYLRENKFFETDHDNYSSLHIEKLNKCIVLLEIEEKEIKQRQEQQRIQKLYEDVNIITKNILAILDTDTAAVKNDIFYRILNCLNSVLLPKKQKLTFTKIE